MEEGYEQMARQTEADRQAEEDRAYDLPRHIAGFSWYRLWH